MILFKDALIEKLEIKISYNRMLEDVTLIIYSCDGRENLLNKTIKSFKDKCDFNFKKTILCLDGVDKPEDYNKSIKADLILYKTKRKGYVNSITDSLANIKTPYFFWLEDDWEFIENFNLSYFIQVLEKNKSLTQIVLAKDSIDHLYQRSENRFASNNFGFSANPCICKTNYIKEAFNELILLPKSKSTKLTGFESFLTDYFSKKGFPSNTYFNENYNAMVAHLGDLESTDREYHMINTLDDSQSDIGKEYISGFGYSRKISFKSKLFLIPKLVLVFIMLSTKIFTQRYAYDFAFRIYLSYLRKFKN